MTNEKNITRLELNKILAAAAEYAVLEESKQALLQTRPATGLAEAKRALAFTEEAERLLFFLGTGRIEYFPSLGDSLERASKRATLSCTELTEAAMLLRSARICYRTVQALSDEETPLMKELTFNLIFNEKLETEIGEKIIGENELSDYASDRLYSIRRALRTLNERIRARLSEYLAGAERDYLQDAIISVRGDRFVLPVKAEYKRKLKGFIHDRSASGATVFMEPEEILEMNNELRTLKLDEKEEEERILAELSHKIGEMREDLERDIAILTEADACFAKAEYGYRLKCSKPILNDNGVIDIVKGRHPLLDKASAVPVSVALGEKYSFLMISGANTGGKTVTLKMCGLFCLMAACGLFVPAAEGTRLAVFDSVFADIGDSQSIEENLSTFSSHIANLKEIVSEAGKNSLVLVDEIGGGTDPEEGQALAQAVIRSLMKSGCRGIVTTHYSALKEYAYRTEGIENGCMEFDANTLRPLYRMKIGLPGSSNALAICERLGFPEEIIEDARGNLSDGARNFERMIRSAEESRIAAEEARRQAEAVKAEWEGRVKKLESEEEAFRKEREKFLAGSRAEARRIVNERTAEAEEILSEIEKIFEKEELSESDLIKARTLKNKLAGSVFSDEEEEKIRNLPVDVSTLKAGDTVLFKSMNAEGTVLSFRPDKNSAELQCGTMRVRCKLSDLYYPSSDMGMQKKDMGGKKPKKKDAERVQVVRNTSSRKTASMQLNLIGKRVSEALPELDEFLDSAVLANLAEVHIIHGMGTGTLRAAVQEALKKHPHVQDFRLGVYGEGGAGVTVVTLK